VPVYLRTALYIANGGGNRNSAISFVSGPCRLPGAGGGKLGGLNDCLQRVAEIGVGGHHDGDSPREYAEEDLKAR
jgi:hypothetical protein